MIGNATSMFKPNSEHTLEYAREVMERGLQLVQTQMEVTGGIYSKISEEYREILASTEPSALFQSWPKVLESTTRSTAEGAAVVLKNAINFQTGMLQMMQSKMPELSQRMMDRLIETTRAVATPEQAPAARASRQSNAGRSDGFRARKAA